MFGLDKIATQIIGIIVVLVLIVLGYFWWKSSIQAEAVAEWNKKQIEIVKQEQMELFKDMTEINAQQKIIVNQLKSQAEALHKKFEDLDTYLNSDKVNKAYKNKQSSDVLKRTFKELNK